MSRKVPVLGKAVLLIPDTLMRLDVVSHLYNRTGGTASLTQHILPGAAVIACLSMLTKCNLQTAFTLGAAATGSHMLLESITDSDQPAIIKVASLVMFVVMGKVFGSQLVRAHKIKLAFWKFTGTFLATYAALYYVAKAADIDK